MPTLIRERWDKNNPAISHLPKSYLARRFNMLKKPFIEKLLQERDKFELLLNRVGYTRRMTLKGFRESGRSRIFSRIFLSYEQYMADRMHEILHR